MPRGKDTPRASGGHTTNGLLQAFRDAMEGLPDDLTDRQWKVVTIAYARLREALTKDQQAELWAKVTVAQQAVKAGDPEADTSPYLVFDRFARMRTKRYQRSDTYREIRREYHRRPEVRARDAARAKDPKRQTQIRAARQRYQAKQKAERQARSKET